MTETLLGRMYLLLNGLEVRPMRETKDGFDCMFIALEENNHIGMFSVVLPRDGFTDANLIPQEHEPWRLSPRELRDLQRGRTNFFTSLAFDSQCVRSLPEVLRTFSA